MNKVIFNNVNSDLLTDEGKKRVSALDDRTFIAGMITALVGALFMTISMCGFLVSSSAGSYALRKGFAISLLASVSPAFLIGGIVKGCYEYQMRRQLTEDEREKYIKQGSFSQTSSIPQIQRGSDV